MAGLDRVTHSGLNVWRVRVYINKRRENIYLGNFDESDAVIAKDHIAHILDATSRKGVPPRECVKWLDSLSKSSRDVYDRLVVLGLAEARAIVEAERTLIAYLRAYIKDRTDWKKPENYRQAVDKLELFLTKDVPLAVLKRSDTNRWHRWMINDLKMSPNTAGQNVKRCRQILNQAVADRLIETNPFLGVKIDLKSDKTKNRYIDLGTTTAILNSCPNQEWRTIFALARFGGLRCPSEVLQLRWTDINWERSRFKVRSSKTERYGKGERIVPLWAELKTELDALFAIAEPGVKVPLDAYVIQQYRQSESNLRTQLHRIADNAGVEKWPKPFMALRATRRTELERAGFKNHVLNNWFGHTGAIAEEHYLQVTEDDFAEANGATKISVAPTVAPSEADSTPSTPISPCTKPNKKRALMALGTLLMAMGIHPIGFEPITLGSEDRIRDESKAFQPNDLRTIAKSPAAPEQHFSDYLSHSMSLSDSSSCSCHIGAPTCYDRDSSELAQLILRWPSLSRQVQQAILLIANLPVQSSSDFSTTSNKPCVRNDAIDGGAN